MFDSCNGGILLDIIVIGRQQRNILRRLLGIVILTAAWQPLTFTRAAQVYISVAQVSSSHSLVSMQV